MIRNSIVSLIALLLAFLFVAGCKENKERKVVADQKNQVEQAERMNELLYRDEAVILSLKYNIDENIVFNLLVEIEDVMTLMDRDRNYIHILSNNYPIPKETFANLLIDYYSMKHCTEQ